MNPSRLKEFAEVFFDLFQKKPLDDVAALPVHSLSLDDAYTVQRMVIESRVAQGEEAVGYKVGCTSRAIRRQFGLAEPIRGRLMSPHVYQGATILDWAGFTNCAVEPEFVLMIGKDLKDEVSPDATLEDAIDYVSPGIEVHHFKFWFGRPTSQELIASNGIHACLVVGRQKTKAGGFDWNSERMDLAVNDRLAASGIGSQIMGGPMTSLGWLVNHLVRRGEYLEAGQLVIPGSAVELISVEPNDRVNARFTNVGTVEAVFAGNLKTPGV